ncbi:MAG: aminotransferase class V-fold PLP-dependent enzyme [Melioribacteraceae bacterium]|nr:aminotransferase class V-fold PLP-dependent enzyme [Melioribacteraceae bacterium]MCF8354214.1 aminotransferase class V-fold PLP-dependent enzyme [Melioribacteraceae bacterium]MCF8392860.1 aminotransferase class V-fold PLP-dependent enzyme [Melioribacteraceae bacterium]MCF8418654.1 aminotransferase class V-fold PLP-dependent enzyme [Melioribacteraceae bacterium]
MKDEKLNGIRDQFSHIKNGLTYLNHATIGPLSNNVRKRIDEYVYQRSETSIKNYESILMYEKSAKEKLGKLFNADAGRIAWISNIADGISLLVNGLDWHSGDEVIINDMEFPSNVYPFLNLEKKGVEVKFAKSDNGIIEIDEYEKLITPATKLISISMVQFTSGYRADIKKLSEICKQHNIIFMVDVIQGAGEVNLDLQKAGIDFIIGGSQKWFMALQGTSYFILSEELQEKINVRNVGWASVVDEWNMLDYNLNLKDDASRFQTGTMNGIGIAAFDASLDLFIDTGIEEIERINLDHTNYLFNELSNIGLKPLLLNQTEDRLSAIVTVECANGTELISQLNREKISVELREGRIRISPHFYSNYSELDRLIQTMKKYI